MQSNYCRAQGLSLLTLMGLPLSALAINGAQLGGIGIKNASMGGTSIALPLDASAAANNPAGLLDVPDSVVGDMQMFHGHSTGSLTGTGPDMRNTENIAAPGFGVKKALRADLAMGFSLAGGGAGADYSQPMLPLPGIQNAKSKLTVLEMIPALAWAPLPDLYLGAGLNLAYEELEVQGALAQTPAGPVGLSGHGSQSATGVGVRLGVLWKPADWLSLGGIYKTKTPMSSLAGYGQDILAYSNGHLDIPTQYGVGVAAKLSGQWVVAADWLQINWGDIRAMQDPNGFLWRNQPVMRAGAAWNFRPDWTLRFGYSHSRAPIASAAAAQNILVPSINNSAYTAGLSWAYSDRMEINVGYELNPQKSLLGTGASQGASISSKVQLLMLGMQYRY